MSAPEVTREQDQLAESLALTFDHVSVEALPDGTAIVHAYDDAPGRQQRRLVWPNGASSVLAGP